MLSGGIAEDQSLVGNPRLLVCAHEQSEILPGRNCQNNFTTFQVAGAVTGSGCICEQMTNMGQIEIQFAKMTKRIKQALISNSVDVVSLVEQLCAISAVKTKKVPLFDKDMFDVVKSIDDFWVMLRGFLSIFDYDLLQCIVEVSECTEAQNIFEEFLSRIDPSAIKDADLLLHCGVEDREGSLQPVLRIKVNCKECTSEIKNMVKKEVSKAYNLNAYALRFQGIKQGCIELHYCISKSLKLYLKNFKISKDSLKKFLDYKIISLHVNEFELTKTTENTSKMASVGSVHTEQHVTIPVCLRKPKTLNQSKTLPNKREIPPPDNRETPFDETSPLLSGNKEMTNYATINNRYDKNGSAAKPKSSYFPTGQGIKSVAEFPRAPNPAATKRPPVDNRGNLGASFQPNGATPIAPNCHDRILDLIAPDFTTHINMESLLPFLQQHRLITRDEIHHLTLVFYSSGVKAQKLLDYLKTKGADSLQRVLCCLQSANEHIGHKEIADKLKKLMQNYSIYCDSCPYCKSMLKN